MKISQRAVPPKTTAALAIGLIALPAAVAAGHPAASPTAPRSHAAPASHTAPAARVPRTPGLVIGISDGHVAARAGDRLTYTVSVRDSGMVSAPHLKITQTLSAGLVFLSASDHGVATNGHVSWSVGLPVGGRRTFNVVARVNKTPPTLLRLAAIACVATPGSSRPIVCAAHLDRLPAAAARSLPPSSGSGINPLAYAAAGVAVLVLGLFTAIAARRRGRLRRRAA